MAITLRFYVAEITERASFEGIQVILQPAYKDGKNADWAKYTPSGKIDLNVSNPAAVEEFKRMLRDKADIAISLEALPSDQPSA